MMGINVIYFICANSEGPMSRFYGQVIAPRCWKCLVDTKSVQTDISVALLIPHKAILWFFLWFFFSLQFLDHWQFLINNSKTSLLGPSQLQMAFTVMGTNTIIFLNGLQWLFCLPSERIRQFAILKNIPLYPGYQITPVSNPLKMMNELRWQGSNYKFWGALIFKATEEGHLRPLY